MKTLMIQSEFNPSRNGHIIRVGPRSEAHEFIGSVQTYFAAATVVQQRGGIKNVQLALLSGDATGLEKENPVRLRDEVELEEEETEETEA